MAIKKNVVKADLRSYPPYFIMGEPKVGKSTLFRDLVLFNYNSEEKGLLISFSDEEGYLALDKLQYEKIVEWDMEEDEEGNRGFLQLVDDLINNKKELGIEMIAFDTLDKLIEVATQEVFEIHKRKEGRYPNSLNDALGGFRRGTDKLCEIILEQVTRLRTAGYALFYLAHTKNKDMIDPLTQVTYTKITNNLQSNIYSAFADTSQMIVNIVFERDINKEIIDTGKVNMVTKKKVVEEVNRIGDEERMMYFRSTSAVECGGRFRGLPEKLPLSAANFMEAFNTGVKNSIISGEKSEKELSEMRKAEEAEINERAEKALKAEKEAKARYSELEEKEPIYKELKASLKSFNATQLETLKEINSRYGIDKEIFSNYELIPIEAIREYKKLVEKM